MRIEDYKLPHQGYEIPYSIFTPSDTDTEYCVLWLQGWSSPMESHKDNVKRMARNFKITFITMNPAGHGTSPVSLSESTRKQQLDEVIAIFDEIKSRGYEKIIVIGGSFGAYMTALLAGVREPYAIVLRAPASYSDEEFEFKYRDTIRSKNHEEYFKEKFKNPPIDTKATRALSMYDGYSYILEHEIDEEIPKDVPKSYFNAAKRGNYIIIPNTKHSYRDMPNPEAHLGYMEHILNAILKAIRLQAKLIETQR
jgi:uncharacterized protein